MLKDQPAHRLLTRPPRSSLRRLLFGSPPVFQKPASSPSDSSASYDRHPPSDKYKHPSTAHRTRHCGDSEQTSLFLEAPVKVSSTQAPETDHLRARIHPRSSGSGSSTPGPRPSPFSIISRETLFPSRTRSLICPPCHQSLFTYRPSPLHHSSVSTLLSLHQPPTHLHHTSPPQHTQANLVSTSLAICHDYISRTTNQPSFFDSHATFHLDAPIDSSSSFREPPRQVQLWCAQAHCLPDGLTSQLTTLSAA